MKDGVSAAVPRTAKANIRALFLGGVLPVVAFALVEEWYGTMGGLIAGIAFGIGEMAYEYWKMRRVQGITIAGNALVIILGAVSLFEGNSLWFKLQPAVILFAFALFLIFSSLLRKPFLYQLAKKQNPDLPEAAKERLSGLNLRLGFVFIALSGLSVYAAYRWSTAAWAFLKGIGTPLILFAWVGVEVLIMRWRMKR